MGYSIYDDELVCPPEPKPPEPEWEKQWRLDEEKRQTQQAEAKAAYERRTRNYAITEKAATGGNPHEGED